MSLLDSYSDQLRIGAVNATVPQPQVPREPGVFDNFAEGAGRYFMRSMAEAGRAGSMALGAVPAAVDAMIGSDNRGERLADKYFRWHDETFNRAVDYWTPKPDEVGAAGQVVGQLAGGIVQFLANPALMVGTAQLGTAEDLVRQGVDSGAALVAGDVAGLSAVAGIALPIFGKTLTQRVAAGALGNLATNVPEAAIKKAVVEAAGNPEAAAQFDPFDTRARAVDVLLGAVFGVKAHFDASAMQRDALMSMNAARQLEEAALPGRPATEADLTKAVDNTRTAIEQMLRGEPVNVPHTDVVTAELRDANLQEWLGASQLRQEDGSPLVLYHGTAADVAAIDPAKLQAEGIHLTTDPALANRYAASRAMDGGTGANVMPVYARAENVKEVPIVTTDAIRQAAEEGYDAVRAGNHVVVMSPDQVKSAIGNSGRYDRNSTSLTDPVQQQRAEVADFVANELRPMTGEPIKAPDMQAEPVRGKPRDLQAEMIGLRKTEAVLSRLLECIG